MGLPSGDEAQLQSGVARSLQFDLDKLFNFAWICPGVGPMIGVWRSRRVEGRQPCCEGSLMQSSERFAQSTVNAQPLDARNRLDRAL